MGADVLCGSTGEVELGSGAPGKGFRYTYDSPVAAHVAETGSSRVAGTDEQDETETLFSNIGRSR